MSDTDQLRAERDAARTLAGVRMLRVEDAEKARDRALAERDAARLACARFLLFFRSFDGADMYAEIRHPAFDAIKAEALQAAIPAAQLELLK